MAWDVCKTNPEQHFRFRLKSRLLSFRDLDQILNSYETFKSAKMSLPQIRYTNVIP